jgi:hypothetical protein
MLQHCHTNMPLLPSGPPWFVFMVLAMLPVTLMQHSLAAHAMHAYLLCPAQQGSQPTGWHCCSYTGCLCGLSVRNALAMLWRCCSNAVLMLWQCHAHMPLLPSRPPWLVFMLMVLAMLLVYAHTALARCSCHVCLLALPCTTGEARPQDVMACSYTGYLCGLSIRNALAMLWRCCK